jgi:hypothetical protein
MERRLPRDHFTRVLARICGRLDNSYASQVRWTDSFFKEVHHSIVSVRALWVVGSYARGALDCGDLDLVMEAISQSDGRRTGLPPTSAICRTLFKSPPGVRVYIGTPDKNTSGVAFDEARLIWSCERADWRTAIDAIRPDPGAKRFPRPTDAIPFRMEQLDTDIETISELINLQRAQVVQWQFSPCTDIASPEPMHADEIDISWLASQFCGKQTQRLLPHLLGAFRRDSIWPKGRWLRRGLGKTELRNGGCDILVGRPPVPISRLDTLPTSEIALFPHLTQRGPNGIWFLGRGRKHPLIKRANDIRVFCLVGDDGQPVGIDCVGSTGHEGTAFDLFSSETAAADQARDDEREFEMATNIRGISGRDLLALLSIADALYLDDTDIPLTFAGQLLLETDEFMDAVTTLDTLESFKAA